MQAIGYPSTRSGKTSSSGYDWLGVLGDGSTSVVHKVRVNTGPHSGKELAIKEVNLEKLTDKKVKAIMVSFTDLETDYRAQ
jgi:hypothetical protein